MFESLEQDLHDIAQRFEAADFSGAMEKVEKILKEHPYEYRAMEWKDRLEKQSADRRLLDLVQQGRTHFQKQNWQEAILFFQQAAAISSQPDVMALLAEAQSRNEEEQRRKLFLMSGRSKSAMEEPDALHDEETSRAEEKEDFDYQAQLETGMKMMQEKRWDAAWICFDRLKKVRPADKVVGRYWTLSDEKNRMLQSLRKKVFTATGEIQEHARNGKWEEAVVAANLVLRNDFSEFHMDEELRILQSELKRAEDLKLTEALEEANGIFTSGAIERAKVLYQKILFEYPDNVTARSRLREIELRNQKVHAERFKIVLPNISIPLRYRIAGGVVLLLALAFGFLWLRPTEGLALWQANHLLGRGEKNEAIDVLREYLNRSPDAVRASALYKQLTVHPQAARIKQLLQDARRERDGHDYASAIALYESVVQLDATNSEATGELDYVKRLQADIDLQFLSAEHSYNEQKYEEAWAQINQVLTLAPQFPPGQKLREQIRAQLIKDRYGKARALYRQSNYEESIVLLEEALELDVSNLQVRQLLAQARARKEIRR